MLSNNLSSKQGTHSSTVPAFCLITCISSPLLQVSPNPACWEALEKWDIWSFRVGSGSAAYTQTYLGHFLQLLGLRFLCVSWS